MTEEKGLRIVKLQAENVKRLKAVEITPDKDGNLVIISGKNGAGKSSVLDSIEYALGGSPKVKKPLRNGTEKGGVVLDLGEMTVERTFTAAGSYLHVKNKAGFDVATPQKMLDKLVGKLAFDPLEFIRLDPDKQAKILKDITGLDFTILDKERKEWFDNRTILNREKAALQARIDGAVVYADVPEEEVTMAELAAEYQAAQDMKTLNDHKRNEVEQLRTALKNKMQDKESMEKELEDLQEQVADLKERIAKHEEHIVSIKQSGAALVKQVAELKDPDLKAISDKMANAELLNAKVRGNRERKEMVAKMEEVKGKVLKCEAEMEKLDKSREQQMKDAKMPIPGLRFDDTGIMFKDIPFNQLCSSEQLKISLAMSISLNPQIRVMLIRDGSLLDKRNLEVIKAMADKYDVQVWLEAVDETGQLGIVIEDGQVIAGGK